MTIPYLLLNSPWRWQLAVLMISIPLAILNQNKGEMDFGSFNQLLGRGYYSVDKNDWLLELSSVLQNILE